MTLRNISFILKIFFSIFYLKCFSRKWKKIWNYYNVISNMKIIKMFIYKKSIAILLMEFDISVPIYFVLFNKMNVCYLIFVLLMQLIYLLEMIITKSPKEDGNCGCYVINLPQKVSFSSIINNLLVSYGFICIFIIDNINYVCL